MCTKLKLGPTKKMSAAAEANLGYLWPPACPRSFVSPPTFAPIPRDPGQQQPAGPQAVPENALHTNLSTPLPDLPRPPPEAYWTPDLNIGATTRAYEACDGVTRPPLQPGWGAPIEAGASLEHPEAVSWTDASAGKALRLSDFAGYGLHL